MEHRDLHARYLESLKVNLPDMSQSERDVVAGGVMGNEIGSLFISLIAYAEQKIKEEDPEYQPLIPD
jgi:hypothetical protein